METNFNPVSILSVTKLENELEKSTIAPVHTNNRWSPSISANISSQQQQQINKAKISPSSSISSIFCRICHEGDSDEKLLALCKCSGTVGLIHVTCLEHWLTSSNSDKCEICKFSYKTLKKPRPCFDYFKDHGNQYNVRNLIADIICFFLLTPLLIISTYLCLLQYFVRERWESIGLIILALFLLAVYFTWCHVTLRFHLSVCTTWQNCNQHVRLVSERQGPNNNSNNNRNSADSSPPNSNNNHHQLVIQTNDRVELVVE